MHELRRRIEDGLGAQGIAQRGHGQVSRQEVTEQIQAGPWHLVHDPAMGVAAAARLPGADPEVRGAENTPAVCAHVLMAHRDAAGRSLGAFILDRAVERGRAGGAEVLRSDCVESDTALRTFCQRQGFQEAGRRDFDGPRCSPTLLERALHPGSLPACRHGHLIVHGEQGLAQRRPALLVLVP